MSSEFNEWNYRPYQQEHSNVKVEFPWEKKQEPVKPARQVTIAPFNHCKGQRPLTAEDKTILPDRIIDSVCRALAINVADVIGPTRKAPVVNARTLAIKLIREITGLQVMQIAAIFNRHHSTITHNIYCAETHIMLEEDYRNNYLSIKKELINR
jgi:chromosomal replication initiation ATPase DnaA